VRGLILTAVLVGVIALATSPAARAASACAPPRLGFGPGVGLNDATMPSSTGELKVAMLFVEFADFPATVSPDVLVEGYVRSVQDWYRNASRGRLAIAVEPLRRWLRMPRTLAEYDRDHFAGAVEDVLAAADPHVDFSGVDALYLMTSQPSGTLASAVIDHDARLVDGTEIRAWVWLAAGGGGPARPRPEVLIHETGHVLGLPDLYDVRRPSRGRYRWDVMVGPGGTGLLAWHRWKLGWLDEAEVVCMRSRRTTATLAPLTRTGGRKAIVYRTRNAAVVVEVRARVGIDASLCKSGVLVYRVDFRRGAPSSLGRLGRPIDVWPARRGDHARCGENWRATLALGRGEVAGANAFGLRVRLLARFRDGSYRVHVTR
jgi:M6 family metalloprotease-like protein